MSDKKKQDFMFKIFQEKPKKVDQNNFATFACFVKILPAAQKFWPKLGLFSALGELAKIILVHQKDRQNF